MGEEQLTPDARTLAADLYAAHAEAVAARLARRFPDSDPQAVSDAVVQAVLELSARFDRYDPERGSLKALLTGAAVRVLQTIRRSEWRRRRREQKKAIDPVTPAAPVARSLLDELADRDLAERIRASLDVNPEDRRAFDLWLLGERDVGAYAAALGLGGLAPGAQRRAVRRWLARLRQRIHRLGVCLRREEGSA